MASMEQMRLRNREVSIVFMQQDHANTLKGLHEEILKLQQKCSDLQFKAAMDATYTSQEDAYKEKCENLEKEAHDQRKDIRAKDNVLEKKEIRIQNLEQQLRAVERKYKDELKQKQQLVHRLQTDLIDKSDQIAQLQIAPLTSRHKASHSVDTHTLNSNILRTHAVAHNHGVDQYLDTGVAQENAPMRTLRRNTPEHRLSRESSGSSPHSLEDVENTTFMPLPPSGRPGSSGSRSGVRSRRKMVTAQTVPHFAEVMARPASGNKLENYLPVDTEEILQIAREQRVHLKLPHRPGPVIPPIKSSTQNAPKISPHQTNSASFQKQKARSSKTSVPKVQVETLAVDQVINKDLRKAHEFKSYGSDA